MIKDERICWFDIPVSDFGKAKEFYGSLFNWNFIPMNEDYLLIQSEGTMIGGFRRANGIRVEADSPVIYFSVNKLASSIQRAKDLGAQLVGELTQISEDDGSFQWLRDQDKNLFSLWASQ